MATFRDGLKLSPDCVENLALKSRKPKPGLSFLGLPEKRAIVGIREGGGGLSAEGHRTSCNPAPHCNRRNRRNRRAPRSGHAAGRSSRARFQLFPAFQQGQQFFFDGRAALLHGDRFARLLAIEVGVGEFRGQFALLGLERGDASG